MTTSTPLSCRLPAPGKPAILMPVRLKPSLLSYPKSAADSAKGVSSFSAKVLSAPSGLGVASSRLAALITLMVPVSVCAMTSMNKVPSIRPCVLMPCTLKRPSDCTAAVAVTLVPLPSRITNFTSSPGSKLGALPWMLSWLSALSTGGSSMTIGSISGLAASTKDCCAIASPALAMMVSSPGAKTLSSKLSTSKSPSWTMAVTVVLLPWVSRIKMATSVPLAKPSADPLMLMRPLSSKKTVMLNEGTVDEALNGLCVWSVMAVDSGCNRANATR